MVPRSGSPYTLAVRVRDGREHSLGKLNHPGDFQAVTAAARALFEGAVDVTLMHFDAAVNGPEKMDAWEDFAEVVARHLGCWDEAAFERLTKQVKETMVAVYLGHRPVLVP